MGGNSKAKSYKAWAILIGTGMALSPIHNTLMTQATAENGVVMFFIPAFGYFLIFASLIFVAYNWEDLDWGKKKIYIPLLLIVGAIGLSGIGADGWQDMISPFGMGLCFFALYLASRKLGKDIFLPLAVGAGIASLGVIAYSICYPGQETGGFVFEGNYDIVVGYVLLGTAFFIHKYQWLLAGLALMAMFLSGSPEAVFVVGVLSVIILWRDWSKKLVFAITPTILLVIILFSVGYGQQLYSFTYQVSQNAFAMITNEEYEPIVRTRVNAVENRLEVIQYSVSDVKYFGEGYNLTDFSKMPNVHNVPLVLVQQLGYPGILAGLAWLWVSVWCLIKTRWKYAWSLILALSVFDHFIWTQLAPFFWAIVGVSTASDIKSDLIFKEA